MIRTGRQAKELLRDGDRLYFREYRCPDCGELFVLMHVNQMKYVCSLCNEPILKGDKVIDVPKLGVVFHIDCYLEIIGIRSEEFHEYCEECGFSHDVAYYPASKKTLCEKCAKGLARTSAS
jgi:ribosomal protein S27E